MAERKHLPLTAADGRPLVHTFWSQDEPEGLAVFLPGNHYGMDAPLLYYPSLILRQRNWDTLSLTYGYQSAGREFSPEEIHDLVEEVGRAWKWVSGQRNYGRLALLGKSLGALLAVDLCVEEVIPPGASLVLLTPPLGNAFFRQLFLGAPQRTFLAIGNQDRFYDKAALDELRSEKEFTLCLVEGADHSMNVGDQLEASLDAVQRVTQAAMDFLEGASAGR
jgi:alpha/beta superfamily hydrolase